MTRSKQSTPSADLLSWLCGEEGRARDEAGLLAGLGQQLREAGLPVDHLASLRWTLHPGVLAATASWAPGRPVALYSRGQGAEPAAAFAVSRLYDALAAGRPLRLADEALALVAIDALRGDGLAEQIILPSPCADGPFRAISLGTARKSGFADTDLAVFERVVPALTVRLCAAGRRAVA